MTKKAADILKRVQSILLERLCEYVVENEESFVESASGPDLGLHGEIYDLADKLRDLNIILSVIPNEPEPAQVQNNGSVVVTPPPMTFGSFIALVEAGNLEGATAVLSHLFQLGVVRAADCTRFFANRWAIDSDTYSLALKVPAAIRSPNEESLRLINELFGLQGMEIAHVIRASQQTFGPSQ